MNYYANPQNDLPAPWKVKRLVFYAMGLKVYGQIPYILQRRLKAQFISNHASTGMGSIFWPAAESNYTLIPFRQADGRPHGEATLKAFFDWLYTDKGFEFAIAGEKDFYKDIRSIDMWEWPPELRPATSEDRTLVLKLIERKGKE
jgi:hypothetical protein